MALETYTLTVDLATTDGAAAAGVPVEVAMARPRLLYPLGDQADTKTLLPTPAHRVTAADGQAAFTLLPSSVVGDYRVSVGGYEHVVEMPESDARLSELPEAS